MNSNGSGIIWDYLLYGESFDMAPLATLLPMDVDSRSAKSESIDLLQEQIGIIALAAFAVHVCTSIYFHLNCTLFIVNISFDI